MLLTLTSCKNPESLIENNKKYEDNTLETFSNDEIINLIDLNVQLKEIAQINDSNQPIISLTIMLKNKNIDKNTIINSHIFSIEAKQNNEILTPVNSIKPFSLDKEKEVNYQFLLNSNTETVLFTFNYDNNNNQVTKHYDFYLE